MAKKRRTSHFRGKVTKSTRKSGSTSFGYLNISKEIKVFNPKPGSKILLDFMPYIVVNPKHPDRDDEDGTATPDSQWYRRPFKTHRSIGADSDTVICLTSIGKKCPVCEERSRMRKDGGDEEDIKALRASDRNLYIVIPKGSKKWDEEMHIFDISDFAFQDELAKELEDDPDNEIFPDLEEGLTLRVRFDKENFQGNAWAKAGRIDFIDRDEAYDEDFLDEAPDLDEIIKDSCLSYKQLEAKFFEMEGDEEDDEDLPEDDEEDAPPRKRKTSGGTKKGSKKKRKPEPEEEDDEDEEDYDEDLDEGEDYDEDEDEDEEPPVRRKKKTSSKKSKSSKKKTSGKKCPYGHKFGRDCEDYDDCDDCELWDACYDAQQKLKRK